ncbi:MAG: T9SS type A sorting domain-containing protein, partial [Bacteroidia bacterium]
SVFASCNLYAGGPYDGAAEGSSFSSCLTLAYAGGPYDGAAEGTTFANCNFYVGGPYDGAAEGYYASFWVRDTSVCYGQPAQLVASSPSDWYSTPTGGTPVATGTNLLNLGPITSSQIYYVGNACISSRVPVVAIAQPKLQAAFVYSPTSPDSACVGQPVYFSNQTLVSGPSQPSLGSLIVGLSSPGSPPPMGHLSFSSQQTANFSLLANGVHNGGNAWTANNTGASTQWAQWYYVTPRSVNRIVFWNCATCPNAANRVPVRARLYYDQGSGWKLAKVFSGSLAGNFDSGIFYETQAIFAQRWKLELDVTAPNAPAWGEFQVYSSAPIIGGTVQWNFGDGSPWASGGNVSHAYTVPGSYTVTQVVNAPGACPDTLTKTVEIRPCGPLPAVQVQLAGNITPKATIALRWQTNFPIRWARLEKLIEGQWRSIYEHTETTQQFGYEDTLPLFFEPNVYRVFSVHENGAQLYSNVVSFVLDKVMEPFVRVFPNPVQDILNIQFGLPQDGEVGIVVYDAKGAKVREISPQRVSKGLHQWNLETYLWSTGIYFIQVELDGKTYSPRVLKIYP